MAGEEEMMMAAAEKMLKKEDEASPGEEEKKKKGGLVVKNIPAGVEIFYFAQPDCSCKRYKCDGKCPEEEIKTAEASRRLAIAYSHHLCGDKINVTYGASIWRRDYEGQAFTKKLKKAHRQTAVSRLVIRPIQFSVPKESASDAETVRKVVHATICRCIRLLGIKGDRIPPAAIS